MIGFIGTSVAISLKYNQYSAIADFRNLQFTVTHALGFSIFTSRLLAPDLNTETSASNHYEAFLLLRLQSLRTLCPNLYSTKLHSSLRTRSILVLVLSTAEPSWTLLSCERTRVI
jgi:hypothetical protein